MSLRFSKDSYFYIWSYKIYSGGATGSVSLILALPIFSKKF